MMGVCPDLSTDSFAGQQLSAHMPGSLAQLVRAAGSYPAGCRFESCRTHQLAARQRFGRNLSSQEEQSSIGGG